MNLSSNLRARFNNPEAIAYWFKQILSPKAQKPIHMLGVFGKAKQLDFQWVLTFYTEKKKTKVKKL